MPNTFLLRWLLPICALSLPIFGQAQTGPEADVRQTDIGVQVFKRLVEAAAAQPLRIFSLVKTADIHCAKELKTRICQFEGSADLGSKAAFSISGSIYLSDSQPPFGETLSIRPVGRSCLAGRQLAEHLYQERLESVTFGRVTHGHVFELGIEDFMIAMRSNQSRDQTLVIAHRIKQGGQVLRGEVVGVIDIQVILHGGCIGIISTGTNNSETN